MVTAVLGLGLTGCQQSTKNVREQPLVAAATTISQASTTAAQGQAVPSGTTTTERFEVAGVTRDALVYVPAGLQASRPAPLILFLHGTPGSAISVASLGLSEEAERRGLIAVYPNGDRGGWNDWESNPFHFSQADDVGFITRLLDLLAGTYPIDATRVFVMGFSNGGGMTYRLACALADRIAAIAVVAGPLVPAECAPGRPVSVLHIHGTRDTQVPYTGATRAGGGPSAAVGHGRLLADAQRLHVRATNPHGQ
jgi:polyhydroxybutyrate depolymerase